jgi:hypothetical protein
MINAKLKLPLLILSTPRTGSTALGVYFQKYFNNVKVNYYPEPDFFHLKGFKEFYDGIEQSKSYIVKIHVHSLDLYETNVKNFLLSDKTSKVRIRRKSTLDQMVSLYIALYRNNTYHYLDPNNLDLKDTIPHDDVKNIDYVIYQIKRSNKMIDTIDLKFDLDLYYEDLDLGQTGFYQTPKPINYDQIVESFKNRLLTTSF